MGMPARKLPAKFAIVRIKGKSREYDLAKIGIYGRVRLNISGDRGNRVVEIERVDDEPNLTNQSPRLYDTP